MNFAEYEPVPPKDINYSSAARAREQAYREEEEEEERQFQEQNTAKYEFGSNLQTKQQKKQVKDEVSINCSTTSKDNKKREKWGNDIEFLFSCIALSVGLGNVWRFPFIALENGGGAFVIPYIIVLLVIGKPIYYMEVVIGQFSSRGCVKAFDMAPIMRGVAYGQVFSTAMGITYYACVMGLTIKYLISSFATVLPWTYCLPEWGSTCVASSATNITNSLEEQHISSAELFFTKTVLREKDTIADGLGGLNWDLVFCLLLAWLIIGTILFKGIQSSGKASYFLGTFPYIVLTILLCRALTLPGSMDGISYFFKPQWDQLLSPKVWYAATTQVFFALAICFGTLIMYASYNNFHRNVYNDVLIITTVDFCVSIMAGCIIFGILGNLAHETNAPDISKVVKGGAGLAFISYPEAIAKFKVLPQLFAVLFFSMLVVLGIGSNIGMTSCVMTVIKDRFPHIPHWMLAAGISIVGFLCGLVYMTPGGQFVLNLVDFFGCSFIALVLAIGELVAVAWIYGVKRFCNDIEFMFNMKTSLYWRICWAILTPGLMFLVLVYTLINYQPLDYKGVQYPAIAYSVAWLIWAFGVGQLPFWAIYAIYKQPGDSLTEKFKASLRPASTWGPSDPTIFEDYVTHRKQCKSRKKTLYRRFVDNIIG